MNVARRLPSSAVRVLCDACTADAAEGGRVCGGRRFFFWDCESHLCYSADGSPIMVPGSSGALVQLSRSPSRQANLLSLEDMLTFIGEWVAHDRVRRFKMWYEDGWNCYVWPNRYEPETLASSASEVTDCVRACYEKLIARVQR